MRDVAADKWNECLVRVEKEENEKRPGMITMRWVSAVGKRAGGREGRGMMRGGSMEAGKEGVMELKEGKNNIEEEEERRKAPTIRETRHEKVDSSIQPTQRHTPNQQQTNSKPPTYTITNE